MNNKYYLICVILCLIHTKSVQSGSPQGSNCNILQVPNGDWTGIKLVNVDDTEAGNKIIDWDTENIKDATLTAKSCQECIDIETDVKNGKIGINLVKNFEETSFIYTMDIDGVFTCADDSKPELTTRIKIRNTNNHRPILTKQEYEFKIPMPFPANMKIGLLSEQFQVHATDFDIEGDNDNDNNKKIQFLVEKEDGTPDENFEIEAERIPGKKEYRGLLKTKKEINFKKDYIAKIVAQDVHPGEKSQRTESKMIVKVDVENTKVPIPEFEDPLYIAQYTKNNDFNFDKVINIVDLGEYDISYTLKTDVNGIDLSKYFKLDTNTQTTITKVTNLDKDIIDNNNYLIMYMEVEAKKDNEISEKKGRTAILIDIEKEAPQTTTAEPCTTPTTVQTTCPPCTTPIPTILPPSTTPVPTTCPPCECTTVTQTTLYSTTETYPPCTTITPTDPTNCPTQPCDCSTTTTDCPTCPNTTTTVTTECPITTIVTECPTVCPEYSSTTSTDTSCPTECPSTTTVSSPTESSTEGSTTTECPACPTECPNTTGTTSECPTQCPECPTSSSSQTESTVCPTECPVTTECPTQCPECPTTSSTQTECPICPTTTVGPGIIKFPSSKFSFDKPESFTGELDTIEATAEPEEDIIYDYEVNDIKHKISYKNGKLRVESKLETGVYYITLTAEGAESHQKASTLVVLKISAGENCNGQCTFPKKLVIKYPIEEMQEPFILAELNTTECDGFEFCIMKQYPDKDWVSINESEIQLSTVDREDEIFNGWFKPQIQVVVKAKPKDGNNCSASRIKRDIEGSDYQWIIADDIFSSLDSNEFVINAIIEDVNDNSPIFEKQSLVIGYPNPKLSQNIAPPYMVQVKATDDDEGKNAVIKYSLDNKNFVIDENLGIITPTNKAFAKNKDEDILLTATDSGTPPLSGNMTIKVKLLNEKQISAVTIKNLAYSNIEDFFNTLNSNSSITDVTYGFISASYITTAEKKTKSVNLYDDETPKDNGAMKIVMYAINKDKPVTTETLKKMMKENVESGFEVQNVDNWKESTEKENCKELSCDETGWIVAVSVLSALVVIIIVTVIILYFRLVRPKFHLVLETKPPPSETQTTFEKKKRSTLSELEEKKKDSKIMRRATGFPKDYDPKQLEKELEEADEAFDEADLTETSDNIQDDDIGEVKEKKKGVMFNEDVEEIHISTTL